MKPLLKRLKKLYASRVFKAILMATIILLTVGIFIDFYATHPQYVHTLRHVRPIVIVEIIALNALLTVALTCGYGFMVELCGKKLSFRENFLLTAYSSIANFFGPLQSGPGVRAVYLKTKHKVRLRDYTLATLIQYAMFACTSVLFIFGATRPWWQAVLALLAVAGVCYGVIKLYRAREKRSGERSQLRLNARPLIGLLLSTLSVVVIVAMYYLVELRAVQPHVSLHQAIAYTGVANLALFVALTPDGIGIRESFLVLSRHWHKISTAVILSANLIDRSAYLVYLLLLFVFVLAVHAKDRLKLIHS